MRMLTLSLGDNPVGADPVDALYKAITAQYPELALTRKNSSIHLIQAAPIRTNRDRTRLVILKNVAPLESYAFFYNRFPVTRYVKTPLFTSAELTDIKSLSSKALVKKVAQKVRYNFTEADFWTEAAGAKYTGGIAPPNWRLKALHNSIYWYGEIVIPLHT